jgi:uncharacterized protein YecE (DUF72 family)
VKLLVGTSGYSYDFWKGDFYPDDIKPDAMLAFYARRFDTVEINNTFYRMPKPDVVRRWADATPDDFRFVIKASRRITHQNRLHDCDDNVRYLYSVLEPLGAKLGATLFQCPPHLRKDVARLRAFLAVLPAHARPALELRHRSWFCDEVYEVLREHDAVLCIADYDNDREQTPLVGTADWGYLRLRDESYSDEALGVWLERMRQQQWQTAYVFFKHEETAPTMVERLVQLAAPPSIP